jgi:competence protein ComEC
MSSPQNKFIKLIGSLAVVALILLGYLFYQEKDANLSVNYLDVGQGDAILIKTPANQKILIDGGPDDLLITKLGRYFNFYDKNIDLMILTHAHSDHLVGLVEVLKRYQVKKILYTGVIQTTPDYLAWLKLIKEKNIPLTIAQAGQEYQFIGGVNLIILFPMSDLTNQEFKDLNQSSIVCQLIYGKTKFLFTGDLPAEEEAQLLATGVNLKSDVLKVGHHGSKYSSSFNFLKAVSPSLAVISVGTDNKFGHPNQGTLDRIAGLGIKILRTDQSGDIIIKSDGNKIYQE